MSESQDLDEIIEEVLLLQGILSIHTLSRLKDHQKHTNTSLSMLLTEISLQVNPAVTQELNQLISHLKKTHTDRDHLSTTITISLGGTGDLDYVVTDYLNCSQMPDLSFDKEQEEVNGQIEKYDTANDERIPSYSMIDEVVSEAANKASWFETIYTPGNFTTEIRVSAESQSSKEYHQKENDAR